MIIRGSTILSHLSILKLLNIVKKSSSLDVIRDGISSNADSSRMGVVVGAVVSFMSIY